MDRMKRIWDGIITFAVIAGVLFVTPVGTYAFLNVHTRADMTTMVVELPNHRKGVVTMWDPIDPEVGLGGSPSWYVDYETESYNWNEPENVFANMQAYTADDHVCMAKNIYFEARNESLRGQMAIALVTLQRVEDPRYPNTVCGVVYDNKQFSWYSDGLSDRIRNTESYDDIALLASAMLDSDTSVYDFTYGSTHYHADYVSPYWNEYMILKAKIDTHIFYYEPPVITTASL
jgi:hypothetical protein